ncbi:hypothetical protein FOL47_009188 [Perkinsus chesapeaki]|uniref:ADP-ribosylation factor-like protein 2-binding protein n=1 Tax=Perkinsus chesapeaki TaxID=330153 RepID=A0A7J6LA34_PERCH|nr:hypothetical protein FOL47_009188 [Perkinsus chesapeaki]
MKLSFSIKAKPKKTSRPKHKPVAGGTDQRTRLVSITASGEMKTDKPPSPVDKEFIIPCLNRLEPKQGKHTILNAPTEATTINPGARSTPPPQSDTSNGPSTPVDLEGTNSDDAEAIRELFNDARARNADLSSAEEFGEAVNAVEPILCQVNKRRKTKVHEDDFDENKDTREIPIEEFGMAMLRGMGFDKDKHVQQPIFTERREGHVGLGAKVTLPTDGVIDLSKGDGTKKKTKKNSTKGDNSRCFNVFICSCVHPANIAVAVLVSSMTRAVEVDILSEVVDDNKDMVQASTDRHQDIPSSPAKSDEDEVLIVNVDTGDMSIEPGSQLKDILDTVFEVVCSGPLQDKVERFMNEHCHNFKDEVTSVDGNQEYKHEHYVLFKRYCDEIEELLISTVQDKHPHFDLGTFVDDCRDMLQEQEDTINNMQVEEVLDFLLSLVDFQAFRSDMISTAMHGQDLQLQGTIYMACGKDCTEVYNHVHPKVDAKVLLFKHHIGKTIGEAPEEQVAGRKHAGEDNHSNTSTSSSTTSSSNMSYEPENKQEVIVKDGEVW